METVDIRDSIVLISSSEQNNAPFGTGFVIYQDEKYTYLLTCAHVINDVGGFSKVQASSAAAEVVTIGTADDLDLAVLRVERLSLDKPPLVLSMSGKRTDSFTTAGYQKYLKGFLIRPLRGILGNRVSIETREQKYRVEAWDFKIVDNYRIQPGYSGSPVLDQTKGSVLGVISAKQDDFGERGIAISIEALETLWSGMPPHLLKQQVLDEKISLSATDPLKPETTPKTSGLRQKTTSPPTVFISYSHKDEKEKEALLSQLRVLQYADLIDLWSDDRMIPGSAWKKEINQAVNRANVAILLITVNYLTSDFNLKEELPKILERRQKEGLIIFPIIAKPCAWEHVEWLNKLDVRPKNKQPIWDSEDGTEKKLVNIAKEVAEIITKTGADSTAIAFPETLPSTKRPKFSPPELTHSAKNIFSLNQKISAEFSQQTYTIKRYLGSSESGEIYQISGMEQTLGLFWYYPQYLLQNSDLRQQLEELIEIGPPGESFLWPIDIASSTDNALGFGYLRHLVRLNHKNLYHLLKRQTDPSFWVLATAGLKLAHSFFQIHFKNLSFYDISLNNIYFDPTTGDVCISYADNMVDIEGKPITVTGNPRYMAPEIVRGETLPNRQTDLHLLAVVLFYIFMAHHPLEGKREVSSDMDLPAMQQLYGYEPIFIFDPGNDSNRPLPGYHDNALVFWNIYPTFLRDLFTKAFTNGLYDPENGRVQEEDWKSAMTRLRDSIFYCQNCNAENFYDINLLKVSGGNRAGKCWSCEENLQLPSRIRIGPNIIMLNHDSRLFPHHIDNQQTYNFSQPIAEVTQLLTVPITFGLKNLSDNVWNVITPDGRVHNVVPEQSVTLADNTKIYFGKVEGKIRT